MCIYTCIYIYIHIYIYTYIHIYIYTYTYIYTGNDTYCQQDISCHHARVVCRRGLIDRHDCSQRHGAEPRARKRSHAVVQQHTSAYVSIRQQHASAFIRKRSHAVVQQHTSASVSTRQQHASASISIRHPDPQALACGHAAPQVSVFVRLY
jgi:hypothetical protein